MAMTTATAVSHDGNVDIKHGDDDETVTTTIDAARRRSQPTSRSVLSPIGTILDERARARWMSKHSKRVSSVFFVVYVRNYQAKRQRVNERLGQAAAGERTRNDSERTNEKVRKRQPSDSERRRATTSDNERQHERQRAE